MGSTHLPPNSPLPPENLPQSTPPEPRAPNLDEPTVITRRPPGSGSNPVKQSAPYELGKKLAGERLNHFELLEYVGGGGMGAVFRARDTMLGREVALKVLSRDQGAEDETRRRFQNEAQSAARLDHDNIARVYYVGEDRGLNYIVFEFIEGINVRDLVEQKGRLPLAEALSYTLQVTRALEHASSRDVVHRDIKPSNILITSQGRAKLVDMGLARLHQVNAPGEDLTASGVTLGTFDYISPEQARDPRSADVRSDIYSLGCTLYFMLTGRPPFPEGTVLQKLLQHNSDEPPDPRQFNADLPAAAAEVVRKMLAKNPRRRYQTAGELMSDLALLANEAGVADTWDMHIPITESGEVPWVQRQLPWIVPVSLLLAAVAVLEVLSRPNPAAPAIAPAQSATGSDGAVEPASSRQGEPATTANLAAAQSNESANGKEAPTDDNHRPQATETSASPTIAKSDHPSTEDAASVSSSNSLPTSLATTAGPASVGATTKPGSSPGEPPKVTPTTEPPRETTSDTEPLRPGLLVVGSTAQGPQRYTSLRAACNAAKTGDVIELRYNGRREERPIVLNNLRFTIRAGEGYQPTVVFRPNEIDPLRYPRSMLTIAGGRLTLLGLAIELDLPSLQEVPVDSWSLLALHRPESVEMQSCSLTIRQGSEQVAFIHAQAATGTESMMATDENMSEEPASVKLEDCVLRGEGVVLRASELEPVNLAWDNGLAVTSERFLVVSGGQMQARHGHPIRLSLRHLTAVVGAGFCHLTNSFDSPYLREISIELSDSIVLSTSSAPLVDQEGVDGAATFQRQLSWEGDRNFYQGFDGDAFWRITDQNDPGQSTRLSFLDWVSHWGGHELLPTWGEIAWNRLPAADRPPHARTAEDYALKDESSGNMARAGASDGRDAGAYAALLPALPGEPSTASGSPNASPGLTPPASGTP